MSSSANLLAVILLAIPLLLAAGGAAAWAVRDEAMRWRAGIIVSAAALVLALLASTLAIVSGERTAYWLATSPLNLLMLTLVTFLGFIVIRYSQRYMAGESGQGRYLLWLNLLLAAVVVVVTTDHLLVFVAAWSAISLTLHQLLMFYPERGRAALAAHKKFLLARIAELMLVIAAVLLYLQNDSWLISAILADIRQPLAPMEHAAALLLATAALIKCAQLPVHGWLIQVVEAPTPISALLHAGVINLGGFLLLVFAPLFGRAAPAQWLVLIVAGVSTVLAALVMTTRVSVKVRLAWSTSAQMGLMLIECALGLFELALLHLVAHSMYKAHAFLNSGSAVSEDIRISLVQQRQPPITATLAALAFAGLLVSGWVWLTAYEGMFSPWILFTLALAAGLAAPVDIIKRDQWRLPVLVLGLLAAYTVLKSLAGSALPILPVITNPAGDIWISILFVLLFTGGWLIRYRSALPAVRQFSILLFAGFYADEWFTRTTLRLWPTRLPLRPDGKNIQLSALSQMQSPSLNKEQLS